MLGLAALVPPLVGLTGWGTEDGNGEHREFPECHLFPLGEGLAATAGSLGRVLGGRSSEPGPYDRRGL